MDAVEKEFRASGTTSGHFFECGTAICANRSSVIASTKVGTCYRNLCNVQSLTLTWRYTARFCHP